MTGWGSGIGLMITQALVSNGAKVYITRRRQDALQIVVNSITPGIFPGEMIARESNEHQKSKLDMEMSSPADRFWP